MTTIIVNHHTKDDAVSPVVGVMLMLVVTIVIAAVVALFATSVVTDTNAAPVAVIETDAYYGEPLENGKLVMSIIGGKALELSKLKCVVTLEDGKYGMVFKSLDTDPLVGKYLEIGEQLEICNMDYAGGGLRKINSLVGGDIDNPTDLETILKMFQALNVGDKVNVMIVFDENAILYKKDIIIQDGAHQEEVTIDTTGSTGVTWSDTSALIDWDDSKISVASVAGSSAVQVTIEDNNYATNSTPTPIILIATPTEDTKVISKVTVTQGTSTTEIAVGSSAVISGAFTLKAVAEDPTPTVTSVTIKDADGNAMGETATVYLSDLTSDTYQLSASVEPSTASQEVGWVVDDSSTADVTVDDTGKLTFDTPEDSETAVITCTSKADTSKSATVTITLVEKVSLIKVKLNDSEIITGKTTQATATTTPEGKKVTWSSKDETIATVDQNGLVTGVGTGDTSIIATAADGSEVRGAAKITVNAPITKVDVSLGSSTIITGKTTTATATTTPTGGKVTWSSDKESVATVNENGVVTGVAAGEATITATAADGSEVKGTAKITVNAPITNVDVSLGSSIIAPTKTTTATATTTPTGGKVTWSSDKESVATVNENGIVTGVAAGEATITATAADGSEVKGTAKITVATITVTLASSEVTVGSTVQASYSSNPDGTFDSVDWSSDKENVATVDQNGRVTGVAAGEATITATAADGSGITGTATITVT